MLISCAHPRDHLAQGVHLGGMNQHHLRFTQLVQGRFQRGLAQGQLALEVGDLAVERGDLAVDALQFLDVVLA